MSEKPWLFYGFFLFAFCFSAVSASATQDSEQLDIQGRVVSDVRVEIKDVTCRRRALQRFAESIIVLEDGGVFKKADLVDSINMLARTDLFETIEVPDTDWNKEKIAIVFKLKPYRLVKDIRISGAFPVLKGEILNVMDLKSGYPFREEAVEKAEADIKRLFKQKGFFDPAVEIQSITERSSCSEIVEIDIDKGDFFTIADIRISGNRSFSDTRLKFMMKTWSKPFVVAGPRRFVEKNIKTDIEKIQNFYRRKGFYEVDITHKVEKNREEKAVFISLNIHEGEKYEIVISGNRAFYDFTLKRLLVFKKQGNRNNTGVRRSVRKFKQRYREAGYNSVEIVFSKEQDKLRFKINEGPRDVVEKVTVTGNRFFSQKRLKKEIVTANGNPFSPAVLDEDMAAVKTLYRENGFADVKVEKTVERTGGEKSGTNDVTVAVDISEGIQTTVSKLTFNGVWVSEESELLESVHSRSGTPYVNEVVKADKERIKIFFSENGYPYAEVESKITLVNNKKAVLLVFDITRGPYVETGELYFSGNFSTRGKFLKSRFDIGTGDPLSLEKAVALQKKMRDTDAFDSVRFQSIGLKEQSQRINFVSHISEIKPYFFETRIGFDTQKQFYTGFAAGDDNFMGMNRQIRFEIDLSAVGYTGEAGFKAHDIFKKEIEMVFSLFTGDTEEENQDFGIRQNRADLSFSSSFFKDFSFGTGFNFESRDTYATTPDDTLDSQELESRAVFSFVNSISYNDTDSYVKPEKGTTVDMSLTYSKDIKTSLDNFLKYRAALAYYLTPQQRITFAFRSEYRHVKAIGGSNSVPEDQKFFLGGISDVRGYKENMLFYDEDQNPLGGDTMMLAAVELRLEVKKNIELSLFFDTGSIQDTENQDISESFRSSAGAGLKYLTPIGPVGFMYGFKIDRKEAEDPGRLHFSIGYTF